MNRIHALFLSCLIAFFGIQLSPATADDAVEILTRGPVHEAFASAVVFEPEPGIIVSAEPPEPIDELPPEHRPVGENVVWIPGYWAWEAEESGFLWISGIWRNIPPGREWVPGYWHALGDGRHQWISGYWSEAGVTEVAYLPPPPETLEVGPNVAAPSADHLWIPGIWRWHERRYAWRPGYWTPVREHWTYVPAHYLWTPRGCVFVDGYWDYAVAHRGVLFAPVHFRTAVYRSPGYYYRPSTVISISFFTDHLFLRPRYCHYYFGDYYAPRYRTGGLLPIFDHHSRRGRYDPIFAHQRWQHRNDRDWERRYRADFDRRSRNERERPPRTWAALQEGRRDGRWERPDTIAAPLGEFAGRGNFRRLDEGARENLARQGRQVNDFRRERAQAETRGRTATRPDAVETRRVGRSPLADSRRSRDLPGALAREERVPPAASPRADVSRETTRQRGTERRETARPDIRRPQVQPREDRRTSPQQRPQVQRPDARPTQREEMQRVQPQRVQPQRVQPQRAQPQRVEPQRVQPQRAQPQRVQPQRVQPQRVQPQRVQPQRVQPQRVQPQRVQPQRVQPQRAQPQRVQPQRVQPQRAQPQRAQPQRAQPQRAQPQRAQPQRAQPQRAQPQRVQPQRAQPQRSPQGRPERSGRGRPER